MEYNVLIIGSDANAYYMARCYHEAYNKKADVLAKSPLPYTAYSNILNIIYDENIWDENGFLKAIYKYKEEHGNKLTLLISSNESYAEFISKNKKKLQKDNFVFNYPNIDIIESLMMKEKFYKTYQNSCISIPNTYYFDCSKETEFHHKMTYPVILKPSNVIMYNHLSFNGKNKIYKLETEEELNETITRIINGGYTDILIVQDFIPGDDSYLFDAVAYVDKSHKVKLLTLAQIGLQEHSKNMVGNAAVLINGYNQYKDKKIQERITKLAEKIGITGFAEFDLKFDERTNDFKLLEINPRQGRSSYYLTKLGCNLVEILKKDLIDHEKLNFKKLDKEIMLSFVPKKIIDLYIVNDEYRQKALSLYKNHINPIKYNKDISIKRLRLLYKKDKRYFNDYKDAYWDNK